MSIFQKEGFTTNMEKSSPIPMQEVTFIWYLINTSKMMVYFPQEKIILLRKEIQSLLDNCFPKIRQVARVTGLIVSTFPAVYPDPLHYHFLEKEKTQALQINSVLSSKHEVLSASDRGIELVDEKCRGLQWETYSNSGPFCNFNHRCIKEGMGSCAEWNNNVRPLVSSGSTFAHQHFGTSSGIFCIASTGSFDTQSTYSCANRQQVSCCLYQSHGRNTFKCNGCNSKKDLVMSIDEKQSHFLGTHPWNGKSTNFSSIYTNTISTSSGLVCQQAKLSAGEICGII